MAKLKWKIQNIKIKRKKYKKMQRYMLKKKKTKQKKLKEIKKTTQFLKKMKIERGFILIQLKLIIIQEIKIRLKNMQDQMLLQEEEM